MALHCATKCEEHPIDVHHMNIETTNQDLRKLIHASENGGTPLVYAVYYRNLPAVHLLLQRGVDPESAIYRTINKFLTQPWLSALGPLLDADVNPDHAFALAIDILNFRGCKDMSGEKRRSYARIAGAAT